MTFEEATQYLFSSFPSFEKSGKTGINEGLYITRTFLQELGNPHLSLRCVHIAGTNGKGSSSHFLSSILQEADYKTGLFTSPHLKSYTERLRINGNPVPESFVTAFVEHHKTLMDALKPSFFEITTVMAFAYFAQQQVDIAIIETGLGGRLDSSNVIETPLLCLITNIGLDHTEMLGHDLPTIAKEKAGIIKWHRPVVQSESDPRYNEVIRDKANDMEAPYFPAFERWTGKYLGWENGTGDFLVTDLFKQQEYNLKTPLAGAYQAKNLCAVFETCRILGNELEKEIPTACIIKGIQNVIRNTQLKGRWQTLSLQPLIICDAVHNIAGWEQILIQLKHMPLPCSTMVLGFSNDKHPEQFIDTIPRETIVIFSAFQNKRSTDPFKLKTYALSKGLKAYASENINEALELAQAHHTKGSFIFVGGSIYLLSELNNI